MPDVPAPRPTPAATATPAPLQWDGVLVRFGEIGIKSPYVRHDMMERLRRNLLATMEREQVEGDAASLGSRIWLAGPDPQSLLGVATRTFGVVSASLAQRVPPTMEALCAAAAQAALTRGWSTFAVRARREGDQPWTSMDLQRQAGSAIFTAAQAAGRTPKVDLTHPELEVHLDVRQQHAYLHLGSADGPGGLPLGSQGLVVARVESAADVLAAWLLMRRGCAIQVASDHPERAQPLRAWGWIGTAHSLAGTTLAELARRLKASAAATGEGLASPPPAKGTLELRPLAGLLPAYAAGIAARHGLPAPGDHG